MMSYHVYILHSALLDKFYIGHTGDDVNEQLRHHLSDHKGFTGSAQDWILAYAEPFPTKEEAYSRKRVIKNWKSKRMIRQLND